MKTTALTLFLGLILAGCSTPSGPNNSIKPANSSGVYGTWKDSRDSISMVITTTGETVTFFGANRANDYGETGTYTANLLDPTTDSTLSLYFEGPTTPSVILTWYYYLTIRNDSLVGGGNTTNDYFALDLQFARQ